MAHRYSRGQILVEAAVIILFLGTLLIMICGHIIYTKNKFNKMDLTKEVRSEREKILRKK